MHKPQCAPVRPAGAAAPCTGKEWVCAALLLVLGHPGCFFKGNWDMGVQVMNKHIDIENGWVLLRWSGRRVSLDSPDFSVPHFKVESIVLWGCDIANLSKILWPVPQEDAVVLSLLSATPGIHAASPFQSFLDLPLVSFATLQS